MSPRALRLSLLGLLGLGAGVSIFMAVHVLRHHLVSFQPSMPHPTCTSWPPHPTPCWYHGRHPAPGLPATLSSTRSLDPHPEKWSLGPGLVSRRPPLLVLLPCCDFFFPLNYRYPKSRILSNCVFAVSWEWDAQHSGRQPFFSLGTVLFSKGLSM